MVERFPGFDQEPNDNPVMDEVNHLANHQITNGLVKRALTGKPALRRDFADYMKWMFDPVEVSDELIDRTERHIRRRGNIFDRSKQKP